MMILYSTKGCGKCAQVKNILRQLNAVFTEQDIVLLAVETFDKLNLKSIPALQDKDGHIHYLEGKNKSDIEQLLRIIK